MDFCTQQLLWRLLRLLQSGLYKASASLLDDHEGTKHV